MSETVEQLIDEALAVRGQAHRDEIHALQVRYDTYEQFTTVIMELFDEPVPVGGQLGPADFDRINDAVEMMRLGRQFAFILQEIKRQPVVEQHWETLCLLLKLAEDDDTEKYRIK